MKALGLLFRGLALGLAALALRAGAADGLIGRYYSSYSVVTNRIVFDGLALVSTRTNTVFDFWNGSQYDDWDPIGSGNYSVHWAGFLHVTNAGLHGFGTISDDGSQIWINGQLVVDNHELQWYDWQEGWCYLGAGYHTIEIAFYDGGLYSGIEVWWLPPAAGPSVLPYSGENFHSIPPTFNSGTKWALLSAPVVQTDAPYVNPWLTARRLLSSQAVELTWLGFTNVTYTVESSTNLLSWEDRALGLPGLSGVMTQLVTTPFPKEFFRLRLEE